MEQSVVDYLNEVYKDNILSKIKLSSGDPVLDVRNIFPYIDDDRKTDEERAEAEARTRGYTYPGDDRLFINNLDMVGSTISPEEAFLKQGIDSEKFNQLSSASQLKYKKRFWEAEQDYLNKESKGVARTGIHEALHNVLGMYYPNAIAEMLKGTSELGIPMSKNKYLGERIYGPPHRQQYIKSNKSSKYEQDELLTQALTNYISTGDPEFLTNLDYMLYQDIDRPGQGPLGEKGIQEFLMEKAKPFYDQLASDAEAGYIQDSIWSRK